MLQIENQAEYSPSCLSPGAFSITAGLGAEAVAPDRHIACAMAADLQLPIDLSVDLPKGKSATGGEGEPAQIGRLHGQVRAHDAVAPGVGAVTNRASVLVL